MPVDAADGKVPVQENLALNMELFLSLYENENISEAYTESENDGTERFVVYEGKT